MLPPCCYKGCKNTRENSPKLSFFYFPHHNSALLNQWLEATGDAKLISRAVGSRRKWICEEHFSIDSFASLDPPQKNLKWDAVPIKYIPEPKESVEQKPKKLWCIVPGCASSSSKTPAKTFILVPMDLEKRKKWLDAIGGNLNELWPQEKMRLHVCEDHFNLEKDMENYNVWKIKSVKHVMKEGVIPHLFDCQSDSKASKKPVKSSSHESQESSAIDEELPTNWESLCEDLYGRARWHKYTQEERDLKRKLVMQKYQSNASSIETKETEDSVAKRPRVEENIESLLGQDDEMALDIPNFVDVNTIDPLHIKEEIQEEIVIKPEPDDDPPSEREFENGHPVRPILTVVPPSSVPKAIQMVASNSILTKTYSKSKPVATVVRTLAPSGVKPAASKSPLQKVLSHLFPSGMAELDKELDIDEDVLFILSLIPNIKKISELNRISAKVEILNVIGKYQNG